MKLLFSTLMLLLGLLFPASAFAWTESEGQNVDDVTFYEMQYTRCTNRYEGSRLNAEVIECLCSAAAENAVNRRYEAPAPKPPQLISAEEQQNCLAGR